MEDKNTIPEAWVAFCYPSTIGDSDLSSSFQHPAVMLTNFCREDTQTLYITAGMVFASEKPYIVRVDIFFNGESVTQKDDGSLGKLKSSFLKDNKLGQLVVVSSMELPNVNLSREGVYRAVVEIHECDGEQKPAKEVASKDCLFVVC